MRNVWSGYNVFIFQFLCHSLLWHCLLPIKLKISIHFSLPLRLFLCHHIFNGNMKHTMHSTSNCHRSIVNLEQHTFQTNIICYFCLIRHSPLPMHWQRNFSHESAESERDQLVCTICVIFSFAFMCHRELTQNSNGSTCARERGRERESRSFVSFAVQKFFFHGIHLMYDCWYVVSVFDSVETKTLNACTKLLYQWTATIVNISHRTIFFCVWRENNMWYFANSNALKSTVFFFVPSKKE